MSIVEVLPIASAALAATATAVSVGVAARSAKQARLAQETVRKIDLRSAIDDLDRPALRRVLYEELGSVRVCDYISDQQLRKRFDELIAEVAHLVSEPDNVETPPVQAEMVPLRSEEQVPPELARVHRDLVAGDTWAALARLRRTLEQGLGSMLGDENVGSRDVRGAGQQLRLLRSRGQIDDGWYLQLGYAISVCNAAVHGEDVAPSQAAEVLDIVARWLNSADR